MRNRIIVIQGPPTSGKTILAERIGALAGSVGRINPDDLSSPFALFQFAAGLPDVLILDVNMEPLRDEHIRRLLDLAGSTPIYINTKGRRPVPVSPPKMVIITTFNTLDIRLDQVPAEGIEDRFMFIKTGNGPTIRHIRVRVSRAAARRAKGRADRLRRDVEAVEVSD